MLPQALTSQNALNKKFKEIVIDGNYDIFLAARKGLKTKLFYDFAETIGMSEKELASLINLSARTISNYNDAKKLLEPTYSEHLLRLITLFKNGEIVFGNIAEFNYWLRKPFWHTSEKPIDWLITVAGVELVMDEVEKLAQGYPV